MYSFSEMLEVEGVMPSTFSEQNAKEARLRFEALTLDELRLILVDGVNMESPEYVEKFANFDRSIASATRAIAALPHDCIEALRAKTVAALYWHDYNPDGFVREVADADLGASTIADLLLSMSDAFGGDYTKTLIEWRSKAAEKARREVLERIRKERLAA